ncbi:MAG TPA: phosphate ABC transporter substrate-binding protein PstS [Thermoplasmata archaeon]|nr:phosphate ABC transporter substrate-binding protein PstS [Thermoplasmata archaeon]
MSSPNPAGGTPSPNAPSTPEEPLQRKKGSRTGTWVAVIVIVVILVGVGVAYAEGWIFGAKSAKQSINGAGSTFVAPLQDKWETTYTAASVNYAAIGSGAGIQQITAKTVDYGATDAPLTGTQKALAPGIQQFPDSAGGVAVIYNVPGVTSTTPIQFNGTVLAEIFLGQITSWNDARLQSIQASGVTLPNHAIVCVSRSDGSGTTFVFTSYLAKESTVWATGPGHGTSVKFPVGVTAKGSSGVTTDVQTTAGAIGYVDLEYALANNVTFGKVANTVGAYILPTLASTASAIADSTQVFPAGNGDWSNVSILNSPGPTDYPITSLTYLLFYQDLGTAYGSQYSQAKAQALVNLLEWMITTGQSYSSALYYVPLPANIVAIDQTTLHGELYNGQALTVG